MFRNFFYLTKLQLNAFLWPLLISFLYLFPSVFIIILYMKQCVVVISFLLILLPFSPPTILLSHNHYTSIIIPLLRLSIVSNLFLLPVLNNLIILIHQSSPPMRLNLFCGYWDSRKLSNCHLLISRFAYYQKKILIHYH